jgi:type IV pilus assembly protein PilQ
MKAFAVIAGAASALGTVGASGALRAAGAMSPATPAAPVARLKSIASRIDGRTGIVTIEASTPVAYTASQPDPRTYVVELRDVETQGFSDGFKADPRHPIGAVEVESANAPDGTRVARIRMTLSQAVRPHVRSARNVLYVEADRVEDSGVRPMISAAGPSSMIRDVRAVQREGAVAVTLYGTGPIVPSDIQQPKDGTPRLEIDLPNVTSALPGMVPISQGPVDRVRIGLNPRSPLVARAVVDMNRHATFHIEQSPDTHELTVLFDGPPTSANLAQAAPPATPPAAPHTSAPPQLPSPQRAGSVPAPPVAGGPPVPQSSPLGAADQRRYTGNPVSLDFQGADLRAVLRTFAEISGLNIVIDPTIQGSVDVALRDVPWDQALDIILRANKLGYIVDGTIVRVAPLTVLAEEEVQHRKLAEEQALAGELKVYTRSLSYAKAEEVAPLLTKTILSQRGQIQTDVRTNTLIITDLQSRIASASDLIGTLDQPQPQVEIEARIVTTTRNFARTLGVQWGLGARASQALGNTLPLTFPNSASVTGRTGGNQGPPAPDPGTSNAATVVNLAASGATSAIGLALGSINGALNLDVALSALESQGQGRILSTPRVATQNNIEAEITQGVQIPIQTIANNTVTVTFKDAALTLKVTPQITAANTVIMRISVENASPDFSRSVNNIPPIDTQRAITSVLVSNGETTVIGGIYVSQEQLNQDRTPGLNRVPLLGWLFRRDAITDQSQELLIFITPRIVRL